MFDQPACPGLASVSDTTNRTAARWPHFSPTLLTSVPKTSWTWSTVMLRLLVAQEHGSSCELLNAQRLVKGQLARGVALGLLPAHLQHNLQVYKWPQRNRAPVPKPRSDQQFFLTAYVRWPGWPCLLYMCSAVCLFKIISMPACTVCRLPTPPRSAYPTRLRT
jgi:hypothetical protein